LQCCTLHGQEHRVQDLVVVVVVGGLRERRMHCCTLRSWLVV
jgi:hypothetical protein